MTRLIHTIFYGSYFYGCCAAALLWETSVQLDLQIREPLIYLSAFAGTVLFYNYPFLRKPGAPSSNPRVQWVVLHHRSFMVQQFLLAGLVLICIALLSFKYRANIGHLSAGQWMVFWLPLLIALSYYSGLVWSHQYNLRSIGWLKPFIIGLVWTALVYVYPILFVAVTRSGPLVEIDFFMVLLFVKSIMFISVLAILFDIKDESTDRVQNIDTLIVRMGLKKSLFYLVLPLTLLGLLTFFTYAILQEMTGWRITLTMLPFILLILAIYSLRKERSLLYYLVVIDGLMLVKAVCGAMAMMG